MSENHDLFLDQIGKAIVDLGTEEVCSIVARMLIYIAHDQKKSLRFECSYGSLDVIPVDKPKTARPLATVLPFKKETE